MRFCFVLGKIKCMDENTETITREKFLRALDLIHLDDEQINLLKQNKLDKETLSWAVVHLSECPECCRKLPNLTAQDIEEALRDAPHNRANLTEQVIEYYFETINEDKRKAGKNK